jgi:hypothetical protein
MEKASPERFMRAVQRQSLGGNRSAVASKNRCVSPMDGGGISLLFHENADTHFFAANLEPEFLEMTSIDTPI